MRKRALPGVVAIGLLAASLSAFSQSASAVTTVTPSESGPTSVVRDAKVTIDVDRTAMTYYRSSSSGAFAPQSALAVATGLTVCRGDAGTNNSPRTRVTVTGPDGAVVADRTSGVRDLSAASFLAPAPKHPPIEAAPSNTNYRGDLPDGNAFHGMKVAVDLAGKPAGTYTVTTTDTNKVRTGLFGGCSTGTPGPGTTVVPGDAVTTQTFEYRPWAATFTDVLGNGEVSANLTPKEFTYSVGSKSSGVLDGSEWQTFYEVPDAAVLLPSDPTTCASDAASCLPPTAVPCDPTDCTPRVMIINYPNPDGSRGSLTGFFDLETKAFIAHARIDGTQRVLFSLGTQLDADYTTFLRQLSADAALQGYDLPALLGTEVVVGDGTNETRLSLLNGLQIDPASGPGGVQIKTGPSVQAGVVLHVYADLRLDGGVCTTRSGSSATGRYTPSAPDGYTVKESDGIPPVPGVGPLGALTGGPVWHITSTPRPGALVNIASAAVGVDSAAGEPNGYPVWVAPFVSGINTAEPTTSFEFVGTGTWTSSQTAIGSNGCLVANGLVGTGVTLLDNPLPAGLGTLMDGLTQPSPEMRKVYDGVLDAVLEAVEPITSNEAVDATLNQVLGLLALP